MAINNLWQDIAFQETNIPSMPSIGIEVSRRMRQANNPRPTRRTQATVPASASRIEVTEPSVPVRGLPAMLTAPIIKDTPVSIPEGNGLGRVWNFAKKWEGGYSNDPDDRGGATNFGIASNFNPGVDVKNLTEQDAMNIFRDKYYNPSGADRMSPSVGLYLADAAFNQGLGGMRDIMRNAIGTTDIDAMNAMDQREVLEKIHNARMQRYKGTKGWHKYGRGWTNRANDAFATALSLLGG